MDDTPHAARPNPGTSNVARTRNGETTASQPELADLDELLSLLGHELRTPLTAILLWASSLRSRDLSPAQLSRALDAIVESASSQSCLIDDVLDLSRIRSGRLQLRPRQVALAELAQTVHDLAQPGASLKAVAFELALDAELGTLPADPRRLQQILLSLLANAIKVTAAGGRVSLRMHRRADEVEIEVASSSGGVAKEDIPALFGGLPASEPGAAQARGGVDLGLALSRHLVELHGGRLEACSAGPGQDARFRLHLPTASAQALAPAPTPRTETARRTLRGANVLVVEDDAGTRQALQWVLEAAEASVLTAADAAEALQLLGLPADEHERACSCSQEGEHECAWQPPQVDVILCDLALPGTDGYALIARIARAYTRAGRALPPACALSAHAREVDRKRALDAGFDLHLAKPLTAQSLTEAVEDLWDVALRERSEGASPITGTVNHD